MSCALGSEEHCKQISLAWVWSARSVWTTLGLPHLTVCVLSQSTLLRFQVALQGNFPKQALGFMHFPDLSCSSSGSQVLRKGTDSVGPAFCALPRSKQLRRPGAWRVHSPSLAVHLITSPIPAARFPGCTGDSAVSGVPCVSSGGLTYDCDSPGGCKLSRVRGRLG